MAHVTTGAMAFRLTGDRRFAQHAIEVMLTAASFPDWNPSHFLDVAEMATALALGYDWLFDELSSADRATIKKALLENKAAKKVFDSLRPSLQLEINRYFSSLKTESAVDRNITRAIQFLLGNGRFVARDKPK